MLNANSIEGGQFYPKGVKGKLVVGAALGVLTLAGCGNAGEEQGILAFDEQQPVRTEGGVIYPHSTYTLEQLDNSNGIDINVNPRGEDVNSLCCLQHDSTRPYVSSK